MFAQLLMGQGEGKFVGFFILSLSILVFLCNEHEICSTFGCLVWKEQKHNNLSIFASHNVCSSLAVSKIPGELNFEIV